MTYCARIVDDELRQLLGATGCVVVEGPKAVGKTATAGRQAGSEVALDVDDNARLLATVEPRLLLEGPTPRLIDEWHVAPILWNHVRREVDRRGQPGQFILTGSAVPADDVTRHTGAGRMSRLRMRPMTLFETGHSSGGVSLRALFAGEPARATDPGLTVPRMLELLCIGGWPASTRLGVADAQRALRSYLEEIVRVDVPRLDGIRRDPVRLERLLRSLARHTASEASLTALAADAGGAEGPLERATVGGYLEVLRALMIVEDVEPWSPAVRSRARLRQASTRHFVDPCLAAAALRCGPPELLADLNTAGLFFESLVIRDLRVYLQRFGGRVLRYRDSNGLEVDAVLAADDGRWGAVEVKLGSMAIDAAAASLRRFASEVDTSRTGDPAFLAVITATGYGYRRPDGVDVIPIAALGP